jgi:DNA repair exonuclease SbcCD ATPase subunit
VALSPATLAQLEQAASSAEATRDHLLSLRTERLAQVAEHDAELAHLRTLHAQVLEHSSRISALEAELSTITAPSNAQAKLLDDRAAQLRQQITTHRAALDGLTAQLADLPPRAILQQRRDRRAGLAESLAKGAQALSEAAAWARQIITNESPE